METENLNLTPKQKRFCEEYVIDLNATQAAIRSGYSIKTARSIGAENLTKPDIQNYIKLLLAEKSLKPEEVNKLISDIARSSLNEYFVIKKREHRPLIVKTLRELIDEKHAEISFEEEFASLSGLVNDDLEEHKKRQRYRELEIIRMELELKYNPGASRIVKGEPILIDSVELDLVKLTADKEKGRIKKVKHGQFGIEVELYAADGALRDIAKINGQFKETVDMTLRTEQPLFGDEENE